MEEKNKINTEPDSLTNQAYKQEKRHSHLDKLVKIFQIFSYIIIPLIIAVFGWSIEKNINDKNLNRDYVNIAISMLTDKDSLDPVFRDWAIDLLNNSAPIKLSDSIIIQLKTGKIEIPKSINKTYSTSPIIHEVVPIKRIPNTDTYIYKFSSTQYGTVQYGGNCGTGDLKLAIQGINTIKYTVGANHEYNNCTIRVVNDSDQGSNILSLGYFNSYDK